MLFGAPKVCLDWSRLTSSLDKQRYSSEFLLGSYRMMSFSDLSDSTKWQEMILSDYFCFIWLDQNFRTLSAGYIGRQTPCESIPVKME